MDMSRRPKCSRWAFGSRMPPPRRAGGRWGVNLFLGQFTPPGDGQLALLRENGLALIDLPHGSSLAPGNRDVVIGFMHPDEPDNARPFSANILRDCEPLGDTLARGRTLRALADGRPVLLNFGQGAARDDWVGQGRSCRRANYYRAAAEAADIVSFDVYPTANVSGPLAGQLGLVPQGVRRLRAASGERKPVWAILETGPISDPRHGPTPAEVRAQFWMALIAGARGIVWFAHGGTPRLLPLALFDTPEMVAAVAMLNREATRLAPVLNAAPPAVPPVAVTGAGLGVFQRMVGGEIFLFVANHGSAPQPLELALSGVPALHPLGHGAPITVQGGRHAELLEGHGIRLWRFPVPGGSNDARR